MQDETPQRLLAKPTWLMSQVSLHGHRLLSDALASVGARGHHYRLLAALQERGPASQATLGRRTHLDRSDVVSALKEVLASGFVARARDGADARRNVITITTTGRSHLRRLDRLLDQVQDQLLAPLRPQQRRQLISMLDQLLAGASRTTWPVG